MIRTGTVQRTTQETDITVEITLDGAQTSSISTGIGFFDHMLTLLAKHGRFELMVEAKGDTYVDAHHTVEDVGLALGQALVKALGDKAGIERYGDAWVPMDEALTQVVIDLDCTQLPATANGIFDHKVKFGSVESGFSILNYSGQSLLLACFYNSLFCTIPILIAPDIFLAIIFVAE